MTNAIRHELPCSSMSHVIDRATSFLFCSPPYTVVSVSPSSVVLERPQSLGISATLIKVFVKT